MNVTLTIDGRETTVPDGTTIFDAARQMGIGIPVLCHDPALRPVGACRMCAVEVEGARTLPASCVAACADGMTVRTASERVVRARKVLSELLMADQPSQSARHARKGDDALLDLAEALDADASRWPAGSGRPDDASSPVIQVDHQACILCDRCIRACDEVQHNDVIGRSGKGYTARIAFDLDTPMGTSSCVECGECVSSCPTSALVNKTITVEPRADRVLEEVDSVCPYCGVGCALTYHVDREANRVVHVAGRTPSANEGRLCVKGRYGFDYAAHPHRLVKPLIRKSYPKEPLSEHMRGAVGTRRGKQGVYPDYEQALSAFREATWDEALDLVASKLTSIKHTHGPDALAGFGSAKCSTEEAYLFQKMVRAVFGTNNVDHCTRLCHASSVAALLEMIGSGAVTTVYNDALNADLILITGSNAEENHPVAATFIKEAASRGTKLVVVDPHASRLARHASRFFQIRSGSDVAFYNGLMHVILEEGLEDRDYIETHTENVEALAELVKRYPPDVVAPICGVEADDLRRLAREIGRAKGMIVFWGMGIAQHVHGTDNARSLINLCLLTGNVGRSGAGLHPLRGQNNVQGASDAGLMPMVFPDYVSVADDAHRARFEAAWGVELDGTPGMTVVEIAHAAEDGSLKGMYIQGENPFLSDPNVARVREAFCNLDFLVVQDIFLTETAEVADVVLPATSFFEKSGTFTNTDRRVQLGRTLLSPPGEAREDWKILCDVMTRMGHTQDFETIEDIFVEFSDLTRSYKGLRYRHLEGRGKLWPCPDPENTEGTAVLFGNAFPTPSGRGRFSPAEVTAPGEQTDEAYPYVLMTGRTLAHWHTGTMTRRAKVLDAIDPEAYCEIHPDDMALLGIEHRARVSIATRRGRIELEARAEKGVGRGSVFVPFHFREASANLLTSDALDPYGKIPGFKYSAARIEPA